MSDLTPVSSPMPSAGRTNISSLMSAFKNAVDTSACLISRFSEAAIAMKTLNVSNLATEDEMLFGS